MFKSLPFLVVVLAIPALAQSPTLTVQVLSTYAATGTTYSDFVTGLEVAAAANCTTTSGATATHCPPGFDILFPDTVVDIVVRMPDDHEVKAWCYYRDSWDRTKCFKPRPGSWPARTGRHGIQLQFKTTGKPEYNKDGTLKKPGKVTMNWATFAFR